MGPISTFEKGGVTDIISLSACGSFRDDWHQELLCWSINSLIEHLLEEDFFWARLVAHVSMANPVCARLGDALEGVASEMGMGAVRNGTYLAMEGRSFQHWRSQIFIGHGVVT
ncbi:MAG: hypothetical protein CM1200mP41_27610 [Gammaproteobacteria bacterium]|nr:MAG: hypothetical protein CM1200mP41_27610 [Gammaproteobacteria bacterium]